MDADRQLRRPISAESATVEPAAQRPAMSTVPDVPILSTGKYHLASGETEFTQDDLADAVAAQDDPAIKAPRIKLGHTDPRFNGEPALGTVQGMRLSENGQTIYGDLVGVPTWLADVMPSAYPNRSIEGDMDVEVSFEGTMGGTTATGKSYRLVLTALALLGTSLPGVEVLEDIPALWNEDALTTVPTGGVQGGATFSAVKVNAAIEASVNVEDVRRAYYEAIDGDPESWQFWIRAIYIDPNELIVDTGEGDRDLLKVPFEVSANGEITFGDVTKVRVEYVEAGGKVAAEGRKAVVYASKDDARPEEGTMTHDEICKLLGLDPQATSKDDAKAKLAERVAEGDPDPAEADPAPDADPAPADPAPAEVDPAEADPAPDPAEGDPAPEPSGDPEVEPSGDPAAADPQPVAAGDSAVTVDRAAFDKLQRDAQAGAAAREEQITERRETLLSDAVAAGKFPRSSKDHYRKLHQRDPEGTEKFIASLEAGVLPVGPGVGAADPEGELAASDSAYPSSLFPELRNRSDGDSARQFVTKE